VHKLTISQRITNNDQALEFYNYFMRIGNGTEQTFSEYGEDMVRLPNHMVSAARNLEEFVDNVYPSLDMNCSDTNFIMSRAILTPLNEDVDVINTIALRKISGEEEILKSIDKMDDEDNSCLYPVEFLNSLEANGLPAHNLKLKKRAVIMLLRNLDTASGACNGTRLISQQEYLMPQLLMVVMLINDFLYQEYHYVLKLIFYLSNLQGYNFLFVQHLL
jgi:hypothetical protein